MYRQSQTDTSESTIDLLVEITDRLLIFQSHGQGHIKDQKDRLDRGDQQPVAPELSSGVAVIQTTKYMEINNFPF